MKKKSTAPKPYHPMKPFMDKLLKNKEVRMLYEEERAKSQVAQAVYYARKHAHLTQTQLAAKLGTKQSAIARIESGQVLTATMPVLAKIARACGGVFEFGIRFKKPAKAG
jgi:ribosome-binding protein aMBF1 (putative translation factor)